MTKKKTERKKEKKKWGEKQKRNSAVHGICFPCVLNIIQLTFYAKVDTDDDPTFPTPIVKCIVEIRFYYAFKVYSSIWFGQGKIKIKKIYEILITLDAKQFLNDSLSV